TQAVARAAAREPIRDARSLPFRILLTSGTSGAPKGIALTQAGAMTWCDCVRLALGLRSRQRHLSLLPLAFPRALVFHLPHLLPGNTVEMFPSIFTAEEFVAAVKTRGITSSVVVPTMLRELLALAHNDAPLLRGLLGLARDGQPILPGLAHLGSLGAPLTPD